MPKKESNDDLKKGEVIFAKHNYEFIWFYDHHKKLCDEISGLKIRTVGEVEGPDRIIISPENFSYGVQRLGSFINANIHLLNIYEQEEIKKQLFNLESSLFNDEEYNRLSGKGKSRSPSQDITFYKMYLDYLKKSFLLLDFFMERFKHYLPISQREVEKKIRFFKHDTFFSNLIEYRNEVFMDLSNFKHETAQQHYKKVLGFFFTYKYLLPETTQNFLKKVLLRDVDIFMSDEQTIKEIKQIKLEGELNKSRKRIAGSQIQRLKESFEWIVILIDQGLSERNIFVKSTQVVNTDRTLI